MVRTKFICVDKVVQPVYLQGDQEVQPVDLRFVPVWAGANEDGNNACEENAVFGRYTPSGEIRKTLHNPEAAAEYEVGATHYVDFTLCDPAPVAAQEEPAVEPSGDAGPAGTQEPTGETPESTGTPAEGSTILTTENLGSVDGTGANP